MKNRGQDRVEINTEQAASAASTLERKARQMLDITRAFELTRLAARSETARQVA